MTIKSGDHFFDPVRFDFGVVVEQNFYFAIRGDQAGVARACEAGVVIKGNHFNFGVVTGKQFTRVVAAGIVGDDDFMFTMRLSAKRIETGG